MLVFDSVTKEYPDGTCALREITFSVSEGDFVFVVGPSGSGKTTLIKMILREELPTEGTLYFEDWEIPRLSDSMATELRRQLGTVFQEYKLIPSRTVLENVILPLEIMGEENAKDRALETLSLVGLEDRANLFPQNLSGGEKQRVSFARALIHKPRLLLADEPTGNIDRGSSEKICEILERINKNGTTVLVSTHDIWIVDQFDKRTLELEDGKLVGETDK
ncbi:MAG: ATP-binding cassette domain-containing protein [Patescibacteria group bacterium]|nr:ATP-binding cassette domain-containing protein [Patescibacteria group bacterium]